MALAPNNASAVSAPPPSAEEIRAFLAADRSPQKSSEPTREEIAAFLAPAQPQDQQDDRDREGPVTQQPADPEPTLVVPASTAPAGFDKVNLGSIKPVGLSSPFDREPLNRGQGVTDTERAKYSKDNPLINLPIPDAQMSQTLGDAIDATSPLTPSGAGRVGVNAYKGVAPSLSALTSPESLMVMSLTAGFGAAAKAGSAVAKLALNGIEAYFAAEGSKALGSAVGNAVNVSKDPKSTPDDMMQAWAAVAPPAAVTGLTGLALTGTPRNIANALPGAEAVAAARDLGLNGERAHMIEDGQTILDARKAGFKGTTIDSLRDWNDAHTAAVEDFVAKQKAAADGPAATPMPQPAQAALPAPAPAPKGPSIVTTIDSIDGTNKNPAQVNAAVNSAIVAPPQQQAPAPAPEATPAPLPEPAPAPVNEYVARQSQVPPGTAPSLETGNEAPPTSDTRTGRTVQGEPVTPKEVSAMTPNEFSDYVRSSEEAGGNVTEEAQAHGLAIHGDAKATADLAKLHQQALADEKQAFSDAKQAPADMRDELTQDAVTAGIKSQFFSEALAAAKSGRNTAFVGQDGNLTPSELPADKGQNFIDSFTGGDKPATVTRMAEGEHEVKMGDVTITLKADSENPGAVSVQAIRSADKGKGKASTALKDLAAEADKQGITLQASVNPFGPAPRMSTDQLEAWYARNGFTSDGYGTIYRTPKSNAGEVSPSVPVRASQSPTQASQPVARAPGAIPQVGPQASLPTPVANTKLSAALGDSGTAPTQSVSPKPVLPKDLAGAQPRYAYGAKQFKLTFKSDLDKALYIVAQKTKSKADAAYLKFAMDHTGLDEAGTRAAGQKVRDRIKAQAKAADAGATLTVKTKSNAIPKQSPKGLPVPAQAEGSPAIRSIRPAGVEAARAREATTSGSEAPSAGAPSPNADAVKAKDDAYRKYAALPDNLELEKLQDQLSKSHSTPLDSPERAAADALRPRIRELTRKLLDTPESKAFHDAIMAERAIEASSDLEAAKVKASTFPDSNPSGKYLADDDRSALSKRAAELKGPTHATDIDDLPSILDNGLRRGSALDTTPDREWTESMGAVVHVPDARSGKRIEHNDYHESGAISYPSRVIVDQAAYKANVRARVQEMADKHPNVKFEYIDEKGKSNVLNPKAGGIGGKPPVPPKEAPAMPDPTPNRDSQTPSSAALPVPADTVRLHFSDGSVVRNVAPKGTSGAVEAPKAAKPYQVSTDKKNAVKALKKAVEKAYAPSVDVSARKVVNRIVMDTAGSLEDVAKLPVNVIDSMTNAIKFETTTSKAILADRIARDAKQVSDLMEMMGEEAGISNPFNLTPHRNSKGERLPLGEQLLNKAGDRIGAMMDAGLKVGMYLNSRDVELNTLDGYQQDGGFLSKNFGGDIDRMYNAKQIMQDNLRKPLADLVRPSAHKLDNTDMERISMYAIARQGHARRVIQSGAKESTLFPGKDSHGPGELMTLTEPQQAYYDAARKMLDEHLAPMLEDLIRKELNVEFKFEPDYWPLQRDYSLYDKAPEESNLKLDSGDEAQQGAVQSLSDIINQFIPKQLTTPRKGMTIERQAGAQTPVKLNAAENMDQAIRNASQLITHLHDSIKWGKIIRSPEFSKQYGTLGQQYALDLLDTVSRASQPLGTNGWRWVDQLIKNNSAAVIGLRIFSQFKHVTNIAMAVKEISPTSLTVGFGQVYKGSDGLKWLKANMPDIYNRSGGESAISDISGFNDSLNQGSQWRKWQNRTFLPERAVDFAIASASALGAYRDALGRMGIDPDTYLTAPPHPEAIRLAGVKARRIVTSPLMKDTPQVISRNKLFANNSTVRKMVTNFQGAMLNQYSNFQQAFYGEGLRKKPTTGERNYLGTAMMAGVIVAMFAGDVALKHANSKAIDMLFGPDYSKPSVTDHSAELWGEFVTEMLRRTPMVGSFVGAFREGQTGVPVADLAIRLRDVTKELTHGQDQYGHALNYYSRLRLKNELATLTGQLAGIPGSTTLGEGLKHQLPHPIKQ